jgi:uncharacterized protein (TIGR03067 family)
MPRAALILSVLACLAMPAATRAADTALEGSWQAQTLEIDGRAMPPTAAQRVQFSFQGDKLRIKGNFSDDREDECAYKADPTQAPKQLDCAMQGEPPILAIYDVAGDDLKMCLRHASSSDGRPTEFATKPGAGLILVVFKKRS